MSHALNRSLSCVARLENIVLLERKSIKLINLSYAPRVILIYGIDKRFELRNAKIFVKYLIFLILARQCKSKRKITFNVYLAKGH